MPVALITGGARGIGAAIAARLRDNGWDVVVADRDPASIGRSVICDVSGEAAVTALIDGICETEGRLDALICNAGLGIRKPIAEL
jgi:NAD(P)-dependent dehydrogenase (short-subunit alcohol dehydrogenase family)